MASKGFTGKANMPHPLTSLQAGLKSMLCLPHTPEFHNQIHGLLDSARKVCPKAKEFVVFSEPLVHEASPHAVHKLQHAYIGKPVSKGNALQKAPWEVKGVQGGS